MQTVICAKKDAELIHFLCFFECLSMQCSYRLNSSYKGGHIMLHIFGSMVKKRTVISLAVLYIVLLMIVIIAGKIKKMKLSSENISTSTTGSDEAT